MLNILRRQYEDVVREGIHPGEYLKEFVWNFVGFVFFLAFGNVKEMVDTHALMCAGRGGHRTTGIRLHLQGPGARQAQATGPPPKVHPCKHHAARDVGCREGQRCMPLWWGDGRTKRPPGPAPGRIFSTFQCRVLRGNKGWKNAFGQHCVQTSNS